MNTTRLTRIMLVQRRQEESNKEWRDWEHACRDIKQQWSSGVLRYNPEPPSPFPSSVPNWPGGYRPNSIGLQKPIRPDMSL